MTSSPPPVHHRQINTTTGVEGSPTTNSTSATTPWSCETNWTVTRGSLNSAVTFESFDFPIDSESTGRKPPLLLVPPSTSDYEPCEIKLNFTQKHEIRQVYVRSTARVYEIYYAPNLQSENEYLCTVRCSAASVDENLTDVMNSNSVNLEGQNGILPKGRMAGENNEDDWVEIKLPVGQVDEGNSYYQNTIRNYQNYYEATAEMNDLEPCKSLTLRLLSLQSKAFVHVDEVYVFADCINTDDSQNQTHSQDTSAGSSLMTMLVPTLLGLSKSRSLQLPDQHSSKSADKPFQNESPPTPELTRSQVPPSTSTSDKDKVCDLTSRYAELTRSQGPTSDSHKIACEANTPLLEQLMSRVTRIEDMLLRFEEKMLKPINNIDARLHQVEQQVESLTKISHFPKSPSSESKPENSNQLSGDSESENQPDTSVPISTQSEEKQETDDVFEPPNIEKPKKSVSIDDALAAALAGFSSVTKTDNSVPILPPESKSNNEACESIIQVETSEANESQKETVTVDDTFTDIVDDNCCIQEMVNEENKNEAETVEEVSIEEDKILSFDKNDILKYFPEECTEVKVKHGFECGVDFETSILEVKFSSLENGSLKSHLDDFLSYRDDESLLINSPSVDETSITENGLLVELDGDDVAVTEQQDLPHGHLETSFDSLI